MIGAHPDDTEFISGGTIALMTQRGDEVCYLVVTSGELGLPINDLQLDRRESEQLAAARALGVDQVDFLREPDGSVIDEPLLRSKIVKSIRAFRPDLVITHSPTYNLRSVRFSHSDHVAVGRASLAAVFPGARNPRIFAEQLAQGLLTWTVPEVWLVGVEHCNHFIDISAQFEAKLRSIKCHESQLRHFADVESFFRDWAAEIATEHGLGMEVLAEEFHRIISK